MGSWDGTCMVTQFAILDKEPCRLVFIRDLPGYKGHVSGGLTHPADLWRPLTLPIRGTFDSDSSCLKGYDKNSWHIRKFQEWLDETLVERDADEPGMRYSAIKKPEAIDLVHLQSLIHQNGRVFVSDETSRIHAKLHKDGSTENTLIGAVLIREDVFQGLVGQPLEGYRGVTSRESLRKVLEDWYDGMCDEVKVARTAGDRPRISRITFTHEHEIDRLLWGFEQSQLLNVKHDLVNELLDDEDVEAVRERTRPALADVADFFMLERYLLLLRKSWGPQAGSGSSFCDTKAVHQETLTRVMREATRNMQRRVSDTPPSITDAFWKNYRPPRIRATNGRIPLGEVEDIHGNPVPGIAACDGDGDGYGTLFVVSQGDPEEHLYFVVSESGSVERVEHDAPPAARMERHMAPVDPA